VEARPEINRSLGADRLTEAQARCAVLRQSLLREWDARLAQREAPGARETFQATMGLLRNWSLPYVPMTDLLDGPLQPLVERLEKIAQAGPGAAAVPAALGTVELPRTPISRMPAEYERIRAAEVRAKTPRQLAEWRNKYIRAATLFVNLRGDRAVPEI
jgi:hypothetical protein